MKKKNVINLVKYYAEKNDAGFRTEAYEIARDFDNTGDYQLAEYIMSLLSNANTFVPQMSESTSPWLKRYHRQAVKSAIPARAACHKPGAGPT